MPGGSNFENDEHEGSPTIRRYHHATVWPTITAAEIANSSDRVRITVAVTVEVTVDVTFLDTFLTAAGRRCWDYEVKGMSTWSPTCPR